ncbi:MAG TPA: GntR family transcriptional regulator [Solirubrobacteraceae bacterium]|nr:GntR family transcriptional regulator [Solirubrobacteraceae bacterium]
MTNGARERPLAKADAESIRRRILDEIQTGALKPGERLGSERALATQYGVTRSTLRLALDSLERSGVIRRLPGRSGGTFVHQSKVERDLSTIAGLPEYLRRSGYLAGTRVIAASLRPVDPAFATHLEIAPGAPVYDLLRIRLANAEPISLEHAMLPADDFPGLLEQSLSGSIMQILRDQYELEPGVAVERIEVVRASRNEAQFLGVQAGAPLLSVERLARVKSGKPYEFSIDLFRSDRTRIVTQTVGSVREVSHTEDGHAVEVHST